MRVKLIVDDGFIKSDLGYKDIDKAIMTLKYLSKKSK